MKRTLKPSIFPVRLTACAVLAVALLAPAVSAQPPVPTQPVATCDATVNGKCYNDGDFTLTFSSPGADHFKVCRSEDTLGWGGCDVVMTSNTGPSYVVTGGHLPSNGYRRAYRVSACDASNVCTPWSSNVATYVYLDNEGPTAPGPTTVSCDYVSSSPNVCWVIGDFWISVTPASDGGSGVDPEGYWICRSKDSAGGFAGCQVTITTNGSTSRLVSGSHLPSDGYRRSYWFRARDYVGNQGSWNSPRYVRVDRHDPIVSADNASPDWFPSRTATVSASDDEGGAEANSGLDQVRYRWNAPLNASCTNGTLTADGAVLTVPEGDNWLYLCATDNTGRVGNWDGGPYRVDPDVSPVTRGRPTFAQGTLLADNGNLLRGVFWSTDILNGRLPGDGSDANAREVIFKIREYGFNALHLYAESPFCGYGPGAFLNQAKKLRDMTGEADLYLVITIGTARCFGKGDTFNFDLAYTQAFWAQYAVEFAGDEHVIFEINNEPWFLLEGGTVTAQPSPPEVIELQVEAYKVIRDRAPESPVLLFSYGGFTNAGAVVDDWNDVDALLYDTYALHLDDNTGVAFHTYGSGTPAQIRPRLETVREAGIDILHTEVFHGSNAGQCAVPGQTTAHPCLGAEQQRVWEEEEVSWLAFLSLGWFNDKQERRGDLLTDSDYQQRVAAQMNYGIGGDAIIWIPDHDVANWPVRHDPPCGSTVALKSVTDQKWVKVNNSGLLKAVNNSTGTRTRFDVICHANGKALLRSQFNGLYVNPGWTSTASPLYANATTGTESRTFDWLVRPTGELILRAPYAYPHPSWRIVSVHGTSFKLYDNQTLFVDRARFTFSFF